VPLVVDEFRALPAMSKFDRYPCRQLGFFGDLSTGQFSSFTSFAYFSDPF
jgi:hypothetical protein